MAAESPARWRRRKESMQVRTFSFSQKLKDRMKKTSSISERDHVFNFLVFALAMLFFYPNSVKKCGSEHFFSTNRLTGEIDFSIKFRKDYGLKRTEDFIFLYLQAEANALLKAFFNGNSSMKDLDVVGLVKNGTFFDVLPALSESEIVESVSGDPEGTEFSKNLKNLANNLSKDVESMMGKWNSIVEKYGAGKFSISVKF